MSKNQPDPDTDTAAARRLADALDRDRVNDTPGLAVQGVEPDPQRLLTNTGLGPLDRATPDGAVRAARAGETFVAAAMHECSDHVVEHDPMRDPAPVTAPRTRCSASP